MHIAICGQLGAGCTEVGQILCERLHLRCVNSAALVREIVTGFRVVHPSESFKEFEHHVQSGEVDLDKLMDSRIVEMLQEGEVIVEGRSAFMLIGKENAFVVLLVSPDRIRAEHIAKMRDITLEEAEESIRVSDAERRHMVERLFKKDWLDPHNYDLVINTSSLGHEAAANLILQAIESRSA